MKVLLTADELQPLITELLIKRYPQHDPKGFILVARRDLPWGPAKFHVECELEEKKVT